MTGYKHNSNDIDSYKLSTIIQSLTLVPRGYCVYTIIFHI